MRRDEVTLADLFSNAGYRTAMFGKWHLGDNYPMRPQDRGFQEVVYHGGGGITQTPDYWGNDYFDDTYYHNGKPEKFEGYCTDVFFSQATKFIESNTSRPFFVYLPTNVPHGPFNVDPKYSRPYLDKGVPGTMANFYGMIENADENVGRLLRRLKELGLEENTIFIFMSDNGTAAGVARSQNKQKQNQTAASWKGFNAGMRGQKGSRYEGGHRVPFFLRWPGQGLGGEGNGRDVTKLTAHIDVLPTLIELCGLTPPKNRLIDGTSLVPLLRGKQENWPDRTLFVHSQRIEYPKKWKTCAVMTDRWRLVNGEELYDMTTDPGQTTDVSKQNPTQTAQLRQAYEGWWKSLTPGFDTYPWIVIGSDKENPARITCHDWHAGRVPWNQRQIKSMPNANGYWMIEVQKSGTYTFTLRHQPRDANLPLQATTARVKVGEAEVTRKVAAGATSISLPLKLEAGQYRMQTWLEDAATDANRGAFFVEARL
jgi:arylsulfatase A-like enzyme